MTHRLTKFAFGCAALLAGSSAFGDAFAGGMPRLAGVSVNAPILASLPRSEGGHARLCADLEVSVSMRRLPAQIFELTYAVTNIGGMAFRGAGGKQALILAEGAKVVQRSGFETVMPGATRSFRALYRAGSQPQRPSVMLALDPKGLADGNPRNDDCNLANNFARLEAPRKNRALPNAPVEAAVPQR